MKFAVSIQLITITLFIACAAMLTISGQQSGNTQAPRWRSECFRTIYGLVDRMNRIDGPMHIVVAPSSRDPFWAGSPYCVVHR